MNSNIIILTGGLSGSSVLAGTISQKGYWLGNDTKEINYQTYENSYLVELNIDILHKSGFSWDDVMDIPPPSIENISKVYYDHNTIKFNDFIKTCNKNSPFLWKDPRLCYTIFFWNNYSEIKNCKFILIDREIKQSWTGIVVRGKTPISFNHMKIIEENCIKHAKLFFKKTGITYLYIRYDDLILNPIETINSINEYLQLKLTLDDLKKIYRGPLFKKKWNSIDFVHAMMRYYYYKLIKRDVTCFPRIREGRGSGWHHLRKKYFL